MLRFILGAALSLSAGACYAGWASGGGELIQDSENPWFIQNTHVVKYCTQYDYEHFHQTADVSEKLIQQAIDFWKQEFRHGNSLFEPKISVATQDFVKVSCAEGTEDADIVFQFGFLTPDQQSQIKDINRYAALAIRTDYDRVNLRGKGFIYVAADSGPMKFRGDNTVDNPWTLGDGGLLYWTLVHELGHVFGLSHTRQRMGYFSNLNVMSHEFIETIMNASSAAFYDRNANANPIFSLRYRQKDRPDWHCGGSNGYSNTLREFFGVDPSWKCFGIKLMVNDLAVFASNDAADDSQSVLVGRANVQDQSFTLLEDALHFWLPPEQKILRKGTKIHTPSFYIEEGVAMYATVDGRVRRQMSYRFDPRLSNPLGDDLKIGGLLNGKLYVNLLESVRRQTGK